MSLQYQSGFGNEFATEAVANTLPIGQNSPQVVAHGLYAEQLSGTAFTAPRTQNKRTWTYRIKPSVVHKPFALIQQSNVRSNPYSSAPISPNQLRWSPLPVPTKPTSFVEGIVTYGGNGDVSTQSGVAIHLFEANTSMVNTVFYNADGEMLIVPHKGSAIFDTEMGKLEVSVGEIIVIPRGIKFRVTLQSANFGGYILENFGQFFRLPDLGPIGANGLANPRDFLAPVAWFEQVNVPTTIISKFQGNLWTSETDHSPLNVVAWHGNYYPYKYDLHRFMTINTVSFDHPDPSIFTVLTAPSELHGTANADFVIFPARWMVAENTFRPPWFHKNFMSEFMGLVYGQYDAKADGFNPGGASLHNCMSGHGPDAATFEKASTVELKPEYLSKTLAFMFETRFVVQPTDFAMNQAPLQQNYYECWQPLADNFKP